MALERPVDALRHLLAAALCAAPLNAAWAGRPMATDDTATAPRGECQIEAWGQRVGDERTQVLAPTCGLTGDLELDTAAARTQGSSASVDSLGLGLKWAPDAAVFKTGLGELSFGLEGAGFWSRSPAGTWRGDNVAVAALASLAIGSAWTLDANIGTTRSLVDRNLTTGLRLALAWQASERWLLFVEGLATDRSNATLRNAGTRWWLAPGKFALDLVASRYTGSPASVSLGLGWYGLRLP